MEPAVMTGGPIGVFDSGYGGLTILSEIRKRLPEYDYLYLGDNARTPYGTRSFETVYNFTWQAVKFLFEKGCRLIILACNTASAKALRNIQQVNLPATYPDRRVLGVIRPTVEVLGEISKSGKIGVCATPGTIASNSYALEIEKLYPEFVTYGQSCPMWVPLIENNEGNDPGADYFIEKYINSLFSQSNDIDTVILGCTHYPIIRKKIEKYLPEGVILLEQGKIVARSLEDYLHRHPEIASACTKNGTTEYFTSDEPSKFDDLASLFLDDTVHSKRITIS